MNTVELDLDLLLPGVADERDQCVTRLQERLVITRGVSEAHVERGDGQARLCVHYDPAVLTLAAVQRLAARAGARVSTRYRHDLITVEGMDCSDCTLAIEHTLQRMPGVLTARVNYAAGTLRVEYDATKASHGTIVGRVQGLGYRVPKPRAVAWLQDRRELLFSLLAGVLVVAASGNDGNSSQPGTRYPAAYQDFPNLIAVGASDNLNGNTWASYSNYGPAIDFAAPGNKIVSTARSDILPIFPYANVGDARSGFAGGTSYATPIVSGNAVDVLLNGDDIFSAMFEAIGSARHTITYAQYYYEDGEIARALAEALAERARAGVGVSVLLDAFGAAGMPAEYVDLMKRSGCHVAYFRLPKPWQIWRANNRRPQPGCGRSCTPGGSAFRLR